MFHIAVNGVVFDKVLDIAAFKISHFLTLAFDLWRNMIRFDHWMKKKWTFKKILFRMLCHLGLNHLFFWWQILGQVIKRVFFSFSWFLKSWNISMKNCYISRPKFLCHGFICLKRIKYLSRLVWSSDWCNFLWLKNLLYLIFSVFAKN